MSEKLKVRIGDRWFTVEVEDLDARPVKVLVDGEPVELDLGAVETSAPGSEPPAAAPADAPPVSSSAAPTLRPPKATKVFHSPMPGIIVSVAVKEGDQVVTGDEVCVLEAMKMHQSLRADWSGIVQAVHVTPGQQILGGDPLIELE